MFLEIAWILFFFILIFGILAYKKPNIAVFFILGALLIFLGGTLYAEGLDVEVATRFEYLPSGDLNRAIDVYQTQTKDNDALVAFFSYALIPIGLIVIIWGLLHPFREHHNNNIME